MKEDELIDYLNNTNNQTNDSLRPYQVEKKQEIYRTLLNQKSVLLQLPTGTGKTRLFSSIVKDVHNVSIKLRCSFKVLILAHRQELIHQISDTIGHKYKVAHGIIMSRNDTNPKPPTQIASVQTLIKRLDIWKEKNFSVIIIDEAHHAVARSYQDILSSFPNAKIIGVTATPYRLGGNPLNTIFEELITSQPISTFINQGYLSNYQYYSIKPDSSTQKLIDSLKEIGPSGDYSELELLSKINQNKIRANLVKTYINYAKGLKGLVYTINRQHNASVCDEFIKNGISARAIDSKTSINDRKVIVNDFKSGRFEVLCNVNLFTEGFDCPDIEFIQLARPTKSLALYLQQVGRGLRIHETIDKIIILDNVGLYNKFGFPSTKRHWHHHFKGGREQPNPPPPLPNEPSNEKVRTIEEGDEKVILLDSTLPIVNKVFDLNVPIKYIKFDPSLIEDESQLKESFFTFFFNSYLLENPDDLLDEYNDTYHDYCLIESNKKISIIKKGEKYGLYNHESQNILIEPFCNVILSPNVFGYTIFQKNSFLGLYDVENEKLILEPKYDKIKFIPNLMYSDVFIVTKDNKCGVIDSNNSLKLDFDYDKIGYYEDSVNAKKDGFWFLLDENLSILNFKTIDIGFKDIIFLKSNNLFSIKSNIKDDLVSPFIIKDYSIINTEYLMLELSSGKLGVTNNKLEWLITPEYSSISFENDLIIAKKYSTYDFYSSKTLDLILEDIKDIYSENKLLFILNEDEWHFFEDNEMKFSNKKRIKVIQKVRKWKNKKEIKLKEDAEKLKKEARILKEKQEHDKLINDLFAIYNAISDDSPNINKEKNVRLNKIAYKDFGLPASKITDLFLLIDKNIKANSKISEYDIIFISKAIDFLNDKNVKI